MKDITVLKIKYFAKKIFYSVPGTQMLWVFLYKRFHSAPKPDFTGWGMTTNSFTPWHNGGNDDLAKGFLDAHLEMVSKVEAGDIRLSQFEKVKDKNKLLQELMWRHYFVYWSSWYAVEATNCSVKNLVECGVCDGLTAHFAMSAVKKKYKFRSFLYDAWESMKREFLLDSELESLGQYKFLSLYNTQKNLAAFRHESVYIKGDIPGSFAGADNPDRIAWLHLDLNSSLPTVAALEFFYEKMDPGGIILLDDYAWHSFLDTKLVVDQFLVGKSGVLLPLPTGQAMFFKTKF